MNKLQFSPHNWTDAGVGVFVSEILGPGHTAYVDYVYVKGDIGCLVNTADVPATEEAKAFFERNKEKTIFFAHYRVPSFEVSDYSTEGPGKEGVTFTTESGEKIAFEKDTFWYA